MKIRAISKYYVPMSFFKNLEKLPNYRTFLPLGFDGTRGGGGVYSEQERHLVTFREKQEQNTRYKLI